MTGGRFMRTAALLVVLALAWLLPSPAAGSNHGWPGYATGRPDFQAGGDLGYFIWHDGDGWHVRWTTAGRTRMFSGAVSTDGTFRDVKAVRTEKGGVAVRTARQLNFRATSSGGVDGFDFRTTGDRLTFRLQIDGSLAEGGRVSVGAAGAHPGNPFTVVR